MTKLTLLVFDDALKMRRHLFTKPSNNSVYFFSLNIDQEMQEEMLRFKTEYTEFQRFFLP